MLATALGREEIYLAATELLTDEQVRRFIADGFLVLDAKLDPAFNSAIADELGFSMQHEQPPAGDNVLARIPALNEMLESPVVRGAMTSLMGPDYVWSPHRAVHNSEPLLDMAGEFDPFEHAPKMGKGSMSGSGWHQDGHSIAGRSRWHTFRSAIMFYFPHEVPVEMGPTRLLAGSHLYANLYDIHPDQVVMEKFPAGTVVITAFDIGHAGTPNRTDLSRYMLKFVALRQSNPISPTWDLQEPLWQTPENLLSRHHLPHVWASLWNWLRAAPRSEGMKEAVGATGERSVAELTTDLAGGPKKATEAAAGLAAHGADAKAAVPALMTALQTEHQGQRLAALYGLIAIGAPAIPALLEALLRTSGKDRHISPEPGDPAFGGHPKDPLQRNFSNRQFVPEDAAVALGAIGGGVREAILPLLHHEDPWMRINAAYALGDMGNNLSVDEADQVGALLDDPEPAVVRVACDALCSLTQFGPMTEGRLHHLFADDRPGWSDVVMGTRWTNRNQIGFVACWALLAHIISDGATAEVEAALIEAMDDPTGYIPGVAVEGLQRIGTVSALQAAVQHLAPLRWDSYRHHFFRDRVEERARRKA